ncbi:MAG: glycosyltransferase family 39 protein [Desulfobacteraceae bacterium]|nr:glycosyltransferase family 39 protein [Desulfobacteraceae bacterium]
MNSEQTTERATKFLLPFIIALTLFVSFLRLGAVRLFDVDEAVFAQATKEMVQSGDFITPTYNGFNRYDKPILFYWAMAASYKVFGINEFAARFPSALAGLLLAMSIFFFVRRVIGEKQAIYSTISFVLSIYFFLYSHAAVTDMLLTLFITLSIFSFYLSDINKINASLLLSSRLRRASTYGFYLFSALAFLTKGLIGIIFPFGVVIVYLFATGGLKEIKNIFNLKGIILFLIVSAPWYGEQLAINGMEFVDQFFIKHHFTRYINGVSGHKAPFYYFIPVLLIGLFPWVVFLPSGIKAVFNNINLQEFLRNKKTAAFPPATSLGLICIVWFFIIFIFFSFSTTKLPNYILPLIPAATVLISIGLTSIDRWDKYNYLSLAILSFIIGVIFLYIKKYLFKIGVYDDTTWTLAISFLMFGMTIVSLYKFFLKKPVYIYLATLMTIFLILISISAIPIINNYLQGVLYKYSLYVKNILPNNEKIITYDLNKPSILFYSDHRIISLTHKQDLVDTLKVMPHAIVMTKAKNINELKKLDLSVLKNAGNYAILEGK